MKFKVEIRKIGTSNWLREMIAEIRKARIDNYSSLADKLVKQIEDNCKVCGEPISGRLRTFCSAQCRNKFYNKKYSADHTKWNREKRDREALQRNRN